MDVYIPLEIYRKHTIQKMQNVVPNIRNSSKILIRGIILEKTFISKVKDPVIPEFDMNYYNEIIVHNLKIRGITGTHADTILSKLRSISQTYFDNKLKYSKHIGTVKTIENDGIVVISYYSSEYPSGYDIRISSSTYRKFKYLLTINKSHCTEYNKYTDDYLTMVMLIRYSIISQKTEDGYQWAIHKNMYEILKEKMNIEHEIFASPINSYLPKFGSLFFDIDKYFGSMGSYKDSIAKIEGMVQANPPFIEYIQNDFIKVAINEMEKEDRPLGFFVIMSNWDDMKGYEMLMNSPYKRYYGNSDDVQLLTIFWSSKSYKQTRVRLSKTCMFILMNNTIYQRMASSIEPLINSMSDLYTKLTNKRYIRSKSK